MRRETTEQARRVRLAVCGEPDRNRHQPAVQRDVEQFLAVAPPTHLRAAIGGDRLFTSAARERLQVDFKSARSRSTGRRSNCRRERIARHALQMLVWTTGNGVRSPFSRKPRCPIVRSSDRHYRRAGIPVRDQSEAADLTFVPASPAIVPRFDRPSSASNRVQTSPGASASPTC